MKLRIEVMCFMVMLVLGAIGAFADEPPTKTCAEIQQYNGVFEGDRVRVNGVVTCETGRFGYSGTVIADPGGGPWAAMYIYDRDQRLVANRGDEVSVVGIVTEYYEKTEVDSSDETEFPPQITGGGAVPDPIELSTGNADSEEYESCLIRVRNAQVLSPPDGFGNIAIDDGSGEFTYLGKYEWEPPAVGSIFACLAGINDFHWSRFKVRPRDEADMECPGGDPTPTPNPNVTPTPTPPDGCNPVLQLYFDGHDEEICFVSGDNFDAHFRIGNLCPRDFTLDLYIALEVGGMFFFWPEWSQNLDYARITVRADEQADESFLGPFSWPSGVGALSNLHFYSMITNPDTYDIVGELAMIEFCYQ
ncbi:hypothetical protein JW979_15410 [bacterium]|nr:hypothetical protein [candidate division CSSED10-310 bacterium]